MAVLWGDKMRGRLILAAITFFALSFGVASGAAAQSLNGVWKGTGHQVPAGDSGADWSIVMTISDSAASIQYPSLGCAGTLTQTSRSAISAQYHETITSGSRCINGGDIAVSLSAGGLSWVWTGQSDGQQINATSVLTQ